MNSPLASTRIDLIDALRGFALIGIVIAHMTEQYLAGPGPSTEESFGFTNMADGIVMGLTFLLIRGKFFAIFSILFGLSFFIQMERGAAKEAAYRGRFVWRLILLFIIGYAHHLLYKGDILTIYAIIGLPLVLFHRVPDRWIWISLILLLFGSRFLVLAIKLGQGWDLEAMSTALTAQNDAYYETVKNGSLGSVLWANAGFGFYSKMNFQLDVFGRGYQTLSLFLLGLWLGRKGWFHQAEAMRKTWRRVTWIGLGVGILSLLVAGLIMQGMGEMNTWPSMVGLGFYDLSNWGLTAFLIGGFVLLYGRPKSGKVLNRLAPYGRTALTNYVLQTVIGVSIFFGFGLGLLGEIGATAALGIAVAVSVLQVWLSRIWLKHYKYGPLEWLWRCGTYLKWQAFKRETSQQETA